MKRSIPEWLGVVALYLAAHLPALTLLPVFADEAIYIRWSQLIQDDFARFAFFSMADGKPPLFMWLLSIGIRPFSDPLLGGRFISVIIGLLTVFSLRAIVGEFTKEKIARWTVTLAATFLPFWFFYHRMALMDGLLTLFISLSFLFALRLSKNSSMSLGKKILYVLFLGLAFGGAMMTKTPALFAIPIIALTPVYYWWQGRKRTFPNLLSLMLPVGLGGVLGSLLFLTLKISPFFGALFARSSDFTFTVSDLIKGEWRYVLGNSLKRNLGWIFFYFTPGALVIALMGLKEKNHRSHLVFLLLCGVLFFAPLTLFGRVLWPRYFLPVPIFLTVALGLALSNLFRYKIAKIICVLLLILTVIQTGYTLFASYINPARIPFVTEDKQQYLNEWSAGYGNAQVRDFIIERQKQLPTDGSKKIIVLTEGSFGTLPDGLYMYFHGGDRAKNLEIEGIGVSVSHIPPAYLARAKTNEVYYVVNSHRFAFVDTGMLKKIMEIKRPDGPSLLLYQVTAQ